MTKVDDLLADAQRELGKPYVYGDEGPNTFDCSGLMQFVYAKVGVVLPRTAAQQQAHTTRVTKPQPGDLVFYGDPAYHVGLYIGANKMINAPKPGAKVRIDNVGAATGYGRVAGVGAGVAPVVGAVTGALSTAGDSVGGLLSGARSILLEGTFVVLALALVGFGLYWAFRPQINSAVRATVAGGRGLL